MTFQLLSTQVNPSRRRVPGVGTIPRASRYLVYLAENDSRAFTGPCALTSALTYLGVLGWSGRLIRVDWNRAAPLQGSIKLIGIAEPPPRATDNTYMTPANYLKGLI